MARADRVLYTYKCAECSHRGNNAEMTIRTTARQLPVPRAVLL